MTAKWLPDIHVERPSESEDRSRRIRSKGSTFFGGMVMLVLGVLFVASAFPPMSDGNGSTLLGPGIGAILLLAGTYLAFIGAARLDK